MDSRGCFFLPGYHSYEQNFNDYRRNAFRRQLFLFSAVCAVLLTLFVHLFAAKDVFCLIICCPCNTLKTLLPCCFLFPVGRSRLRYLEFLVEKARFLTTYFLVVVHELRLWHRRLAICECFQQRKVKQSVLVLKQNTTRVIDTHTNVTFFYQGNFKRL